MAPGFLTLYEPGTSVSVTLKTDGSGNVAQLNELVEIVGENSTHTEVARCATRGAAVAMVETLPNEYDSSKNYGNDVEVGEATVLVRHAVDWLIPEASPAAGDMMTSTTSGTVDALDTAGGDTGDMAIGPVWTTLNRGAQTDGKVAVVRQR